MRRKVDRDLQPVIPGINYDQSPAGQIERLGLVDLRNLYPVSPDYHGPTEFQVYKPIDNKGLFPFKDNSQMNWDHKGISINGAPVSFNVRYRNGDNPVKSDITNFVATHPYPHEQAPLEHIDDYDTAILKYQERVSEELEFHIEHALEIAAQHPEYGEPVFPLAFNGAKPVGHLLTEKFGIDQSQLFTAQVKRVPLTDGGLVIAAGGIEFPNAVKQEQSIFPIFLDDCLATWATQSYMKELLLAGGSQINAQFYGAVVGTRHPFMKEFATASIPTAVSISTPCFQLGGNAYLLNPDGTMQVGDMGMIINQSIAGNGCMHQKWGGNTQAHLQYQ